MLNKYHNKWFSIKSFEIFLQFFPKLKNASEERGFWHVMACEAWCVRLWVTLIDSWLLSQWPSKGWFAINTLLITCTDWKCSQSEMRHSLSLTILFLIWKIVVTAYCTCSSETDMCKAATRHWFPIQFLWAFNVSTPSFHSCIEHSFHIQKKKVNHSVFHFKLFQCFS